MSTSPHHLLLRAIFSGWLTAFALTSVLFPAICTGEELGRLFFTPERRQTLDRQRQLNIQENQEIAENPTLTVNGVVTRSSGRRTAWINGISQNENESQSGVTVTPNRRDPGKVVVQTGELPLVKAKIGDTVNRNTGDASGLLNGGSIKINRPHSSNIKRN